MPPATQNPLVIAAYVVGILLSLPVLVVLFKAVFFIAGATNKLDAVSSNVEKLTASVADLRHFAESGSQANELSLFIIETDVNTLQDKAGLPRRDYPDRRIGPADRRSA